MRPFGPGQGLIFALGRARHDFNLHHAARALAQRGADAVRAGVAAADHDHLPSLRVQVRRNFGAVLLRVIVAAQIIHRLMHAGERPPRAFQIARLFTAEGEHQRVMLLAQGVHRQIAPDFHAGMEGHALRLHLFQAAVNQRLVQFEIGDAVTQQAADAHLAVI